MNLEQDYFAFLGLPQSYDIDLSALSARYRELQKMLHPDKFAHLSESERRRSVQYTAHLNEALATLKSPLKRAQYLLSLNGFDTYTEVSAQLPPAFLFEQMELRERLESVKKDECGLDELAGEVDKTLRQYQATLLQLFVSNSETAFQEAVSWVRKMQFMVKLQSEIELAESELDE